jgi:hypothetical protein
VVGGRDRVQDGEGRGTAEHLLGEHRVKFDAVELGARERAGLVPDRVRDGGRAELMDQGRPSERRGLAIAEPEHLGGVHAELCAPTAVAGHVRRFQVDEVRRHREGVVELGAVESAVRPRLEVEHGVPRLGARLPTTKEDTMILATTKVEDYDRFLKVFSTKGADKRAQHGSKGSTVFRDPAEDDRVWVLFDWDAQGWQNFVSDPEVPAILQEAGHRGKPQAAQLGGRYDS